MLDEREGEVPADQLERSFNRKSLAARSAIVAAGPLFNLAFAVLAYWGLFVVGHRGGCARWSASSTVGSVAAASGFR